MSSRLPTIPAVEICEPTSAAVPVLVSIPHAGRVYPPTILAASRVQQVDLARLEDAWCDLIAAPAIHRGAAVVRASWARAVADCNRAEGQMAPGEVANEIRHHFTVPGRKERAGLGVVPTRLAHVGPLWTRPIDEAGLAWRLDQFHRPYHRILGERLAALREHFGWAVLIDLHSMPAIPVAQPGHGATIVIGDHFGSAADPGVLDAVWNAARELGETVSLNQPYAGGHITRSHGQPHRSIHAIQIEIDRSLYLRADRTPDSGKVDRLSVWFSRLVDTVAAARPDDRMIPIAAE